MKLEDARTAYETLSGRASDIVRQLSLAGIGLIWVFKTTTGASYSLDPPLLKAVLFIFVALSLDFLQYALGTTIWFIYFRLKEKEGTKEDHEFKAPSWLNWPTWTLFYAKAAAMLVAYACYIIPFLISKF